MFYRGPIVPCSICDSTLVTAQIKEGSVDATLKPTVQMRRDLEAGLPPKTEVFPCDIFDETLVGNATLRCVQTGGPPTLQGSAQNCSRRTYEATEGFSYNQDPGWQNADADPETNCGGISLVSGFNPLISLPVEDVGRCQSAGSWATWGREAFVGSDWVDGEHERWGSFCVDCDVETGYEGGTATIRLYRDASCSPLSHSRKTRLAVDQCAFDSGRQVRYSATCDVKSFACPRPTPAVQVSTHRSLSPQRAATCASEPELLYAFGAEHVGMDKCVKISRNNTDGVTVYRSLRVCCTGSAARLRFYTDQDCTVPGPTDDNVEYQLGCNSITDDESGTLRHVKAVCSVPAHYCPPLRDIGNARATIAANADSEDEETGTNTGIAVLVVVAAIIVAAVVAGVIAAKFGWNYRKTLFGESDTGNAAFVKTVSQPKERSEKQKIFEQYRATSNKDADSPDGASVSTSDASNIAPSLPGSIGFHDDGTIGSPSYLNMLDLHCVYSASVNFKTHRFAHLQSKTPYTQPGWLRQLLLKTRST